MTLSKPKAGLQDYCNKPLKSRMSAFSKVQKLKKIKNNKCLVLIAINAIMWFHKKSKGPIISIIT